MHSCHTWPSFTCLTALRTSEPTSIHPELCTLGLDDIVKQFKYQSTLQIYRFTAAAMVSEARQRAMETNRSLRTIKNVS